MLGSPEPGAKTTLEAFAAAGEIGSVTLLGGEAIEWAGAEDGLTLVAPATKVDTAALVYKISMK